MQARVDHLRTRKEANSKNWASEDADHYYHALNYRLHQQVHSLEEQIKVEGFISFYHRQK